MKQEQPAGDDILAHLAQRYAFREVAALTDDPSAQAWCAFGQQLLDLDAEDFGFPESEANRQGGFPESEANRQGGFPKSEAGRPGGPIPHDLRLRALACRVPQTAKEQPRGALADLRPIYRLLLEIMAIRWRRHEMAALVAALHISAEYLPILAWQPVLGHAADPALLNSQFARSRFGDQEDRGCPHTRTQKSATSRAVRVATEPPEGWRAYLDRQHSTVADALAVCAAQCPNQCSAITQFSAEQREELHERCRIAGAFSDAALVRLRHAAPVGHGFGVPSPAEVQAAWARTREAFALREGAVARAATVDDGYFLPGLPSLFSQIADTSLTPDNLVAAAANGLASAVRRR